MRRVLVIGCSGAGKTTLARRIAEIRGLPFVELDRYFWRAGWTETPKEEWHATVARLAKAPAWVMDGTYAGTLHLRLPRADTIVWLDFPRWLCLTRVIVRALWGLGKVREGLPEGCPERLDMHFLNYVWTFRKIHRPRVVVALERLASHVRLHHLRTRADVKRLLANLGEG